MYFFRIYYFLCNYILKSIKEYLIQKCLLNKKNAITWRTNPKSPTCLSALSDMTRTKMTYICRVMSQLSLIS